MGEIDDVPGNAGNADKDRCPDRRVRMCITGQLGIVLICVRFPCCQMTEACMNGITAFVRYQEKEQLRSKLLLAISSDAGFGFL